ncbi:hypothetical protein DPEC_G00024850 [Dallia pectoralis]|uniref:Uncharacterized protein n=1 Tax=Dallia pectoralis TaxID=75939 RepID=A0ACC2HHS7_DALPE|nr:hypothetical protein DPEC_G00024850 [Dallia pectoralis]
MGFHGEVQLREPRVCTKSLWYKRLKSQSPLLSPLLYPPLPPPRPFLFRGAHRRRRGRCVLPISILAGDQITHTSGPRRGRGIYPSYEDNDHTPPYGILCGVWSCGPLR